MKRNLILVAMMLLVAGTVSAQVANTAHDLSASSTSGNATTNVDRICVFCHTPHQSGTTVDPLWNHTLSSTGTYGVYASATLQATPGEIGGGSAVSNLCMSCHDGTVSVASFYNAPNELGGVAANITAGGNVNGSGLMTGTPNVGTDLTNDHPVNFTYDAALVTADTADNGGVAGLNNPAGAAVAALLSGGTVQCSSCHDPHDDTNSPFLVMDNTGSVLCSTCHIK